MEILIIFVSFYFALVLNKFVNTYEKLYCNRIEFYISNVILFPIHVSNYLLYVH